MDYLLRHGKAYPHHSMVSTIKARKHGFHDCVDTEEMFQTLFTELNPQISCRRRKMGRDNLIGTIFIALSILVIALAWHADVLAFYANTATG